MCAKMCASFGGVSVLDEIPKVSLKWRDGSVKICIYFNRVDRKYIATGVKIARNEWADGVVVKRKDAASLNRMLYGKVDEIQRKLIVWCANNEDVSIYTIDMLLSREKVQRGDFLQYMEERIEERQLCLATKKYHRCVLAALKRFGGIRSYASINVSNIYRWDEWLRREDTSRTPQTVHNYHKTVKAYLNECVRRGIIKDNPYRQFVYNRGKSKERMPLTEEWIVKVRDAELSGRHRKARDLFVFMCYTGVSYVDMQSITRDDIVERDGNYYIRSHREKTGEVYFTPVLPPAVRVLEKYDFKLPSVTNQKMNIYLHEIEVLLGVPVSMTCHVARHSFATLMLRYDVPIPVVAKMLGHASTRTTEVYAKVLQQNVEEKSSNVMRLIK